MGRNLQPEYFPRDYKLVYGSQPGQTNPQPEKFKNLGFLQQYQIFTSLFKNLSPPGIVFTPLGKSIHRLQQFRASSPRLP